MSLFCDSIDRGDAPDPAVMQELAALFRALLEAVSDTGKQRAQRIVKALALGATRGRKAMLERTSLMEVAVAVAIARRKRVKKPTHTVAAEYGMPESTVRNIYRTHKANAEELAQAGLHFQAIVERVLQHTAQVERVLQRAAKESELVERALQHGAEARALAERLAESEAQAQRFGYLFGPGLTKLLRKVARSK